MPQEDISEKKFSFSAFKDLWRNSVRITKMVLQDRRKDVLILFGLIIILAGTPFIFQWVRGGIINELVRIVQGKPFTSYLMWLFVMLAIAEIAPSLFRTVRRYLFRIFYFYLGEKFELLFIHKLGEIDLAAHEDPKHNNLFNKVKENGVWRMQNFFDRMFDIVETVFEVIVASLIILSFSWWVFLLIILGTLPELFFEFRFGKVTWNIHSTRAEIKRRFWYLREHFTELRSLAELKLFQNIPHFFNLTKDLFVRFQSEEQAKEKQKLKLRLIITIFSQGIMVFATIWFVFEVVHGNILVGTLTFLLASMSQFRGSLSGLFSYLGQQYEDSLFITDAFKFIDIPPLLKKPEKGIALSPHKTPIIEFRNVSFNYPQQEKSVLHRINLTINAGEKLAIVGVNGAGKTTFVKLITRFYDPTEGTVFINGHNLKDIDLESWYAQLGVIFQDYAHYRFLVKEAIGVGRTSEKRKEKKVREAAEVSEAHSFIHEFKERYDQMLGKEFEGGIEPSIGQWQKLALARTFYRDPRVFILDEPTSSIDAEAEQKIFETLESLPKDRTVILISHRFSTVRRADRIIVIEDNRIKELGSHAQLLKLKGTYARLFALQAKGYK